MFEWIESWWIAGFLRHSIWAYPIVNALHVLGLGALVTSALVMDARILGLASRLPVRAVTGLMRPVAIGALTLAAISGFLLFSVRPIEYVTNPVFPLKLGLLTLAVANAGIFVATGRERQPQSVLTRTMACFSIFIWLTVLMAGRSIAFFE